MVLMRVVGGLGNQLFQYAIGRSLAKRKNSKLLLDLAYYKINRQHPYLLSHFNCQFNKATPNDVKSVTFLNKYLHKVYRWINKGKPVSARKIVANYESDYFEEVFNVSTPVYIEGYWQSPKYFQGIAPIIRDECRIATKPKGLNKKYIDQIRRENSVSIHIRRGDYITDKAASEKHGVCSMDYYKRAIQEIENNVSDPSYYIFSDDKEWVLKHFTMLNKAHFMTFNDINEAHEDMRLMYSCKHHIIANSTFSWWGAWLNRYSQKIVIAPGNWFKGLDSNANNLIPSSWRIL